MPKSVYKKIAKVANIVRQFLFGPETNSEYSNLDYMNDQIKTEMGIKILYTNSHIFDGCLIWDKHYKKPVIIISRADGFYRREFTIAHELGHLLLHWKWNPSVDLTSKAEKQSNILDTYKKHPAMFRGITYTKSGRLAEKQANEFAANLLMPYKLVKDIYNKSISTDLDYVKVDVSNRLEVSEDAAYHRLKNLKIRGEL